LEWNVNKVNHHHPQSNTLLTSREKKPIWVPCTKKCSFKFSATPFASQTPQPSIFFRIFFSCLPLC
jgi:hypothetical protein